MARSKVFARKSAQGESDEESNGHSNSSPVARIAIRRKKYKFRQGTQTLREIRRQQRATTHAIPKIPFSRLVREISTRHKPDLRWQKKAFYALQSACEQLIIELMEDCNLVAINSKRITIMPRDLALVQKLQSNKFPAHRFLRKNHYIEWERPKRKQLAKKIREAAKIKKKPKNKKKPRKK